MAIQTIQLGGGGGGRVKPYHFSALSAGSSDSFPNVGKILTAEGDTRIISIEGKGFLHYLNIPACSIFNIMIDEARPFIGFTSSVDSSSYNTKIVEAYSPLSGMMLDDGLEPLIYVFEQQYTGSAIIRRMVLPTINTTTGATDNYSKEYFFANYKNGTINPKTVAMRKEVFTFGDLYFNKSIDIYVKYFNDGSLKPVVGTVGLEV